MHIAIGEQHLLYGINQPKLRDTLHREPHTVCHPICRDMWEAEAGPGGQGGGKCIIYVYDKMRSRQFDGGQIHRSASVRFMRVAIY